MRLPSRIYRFINHPEFRIKTNIPSLLPKIYIRLTLNPKKIILIPINLCLKIYNRLTLVPDMKKILLNVLIKCIDCLQLLHSKVSQNRNSLKAYTPLSPTDEADEIANYIESLDWALQNNKRIKNIALAGPFGSGKSSVIQTFQKRNHNKNFELLHIQLIDKDSEELIENIDSFELENEDILALLKSSKIPITVKEKIINNFDVSLFDNDSDLLNQIGNLLIENISLDVDNSLVKPVLINSNLKVSQKVELFNKKNEIFNDAEEINEIFFSFGEPYSEITENGKRPLIDESGINNEFVEILKSKKYISGFRIEKKGIRISTFKK